MSAPAKPKCPAPASKQDLRREINELRHVGRQLANVAYNIGQGRTMTVTDRTICKQLCAEWDAIQRAEGPKGARSK